MKMKKIGCFFIYTIFLLIVGMGIYKYREVIIDYLAQQYHTGIEYIKNKAPDNIIQVKDNIKDTVN